MKTNFLRLLISTVVLIGGLLPGVSSRAAVSGINSPAGSFATIQFIDTTSLDPSSNPGLTSLNQTITPWGGGPPINNTLSLTTDSVTLDTAQGDIVADVIGGNYSLALNNVLLNQAPLNTGFAHLIFQFSVEFQIDAFGLASQPTLFPNFLVNGTVQNTTSSFAAINGWIDYYGVNAAGTYGVLETVNYSALFNTPGSFSGTVSGIPVFGTTPNLVANTTLTLVGNIDFMVDPASISVETVPEPTTGLLALLSLPALLLRRKV
jgi:hypothetical protein